MTSIDLLLIIYF